MRENFVKDTITQRFGVLPGVNAVVVEQDGRIIYLSSRFPALFEMQKDAAPVIESVYVRYPDVQSPHVAPVTRFASLEEIARWMDAIDHVAG